MVSYFTASSLGFGATRPHVRRARPLSNRMARGLRRSSGSGSPNAFSRAEAMSSVTARARSPGS